MILTAYSVGIFSMAMCGVVLIASLWVALSLANVWTRQTSLLRGTGMFVMCGLCGWALASALSRGFWK